LRCTPVPEINYEDSRAFPYDKVIELIDDMPSFREKTYYSLLAASGCRGHEGEQILLYDDINIADRSVRLVDPRSRPSHASYIALTPIERSQLSWKGRTSDVTLLIEPFASIFFESLEKYLEHEYLPHGKHNFLFQTLQGENFGRPRFLSDKGEALKRFHRICKRIGVQLPPRTGPHSLRHMYGTYLLNYFPRSSGDYGLPIWMVQQLMGHKDIESTQKYARTDKDLLQLEIEHANRVIFSKGTPKTLIELKLGALEAQVQRTRQLLDGHRL
jgi:integrase